MSVTMMSAMTPATLWADTNVLAPKGLNKSIYLHINNFARHTEWAHGFMHTYALWLGAVLLAAIFVVTYGIVWWRRDHRVAALMGLSGAGTLIALGLNQIIGHWAKELRPYNSLHHVLVLVPKANDYAFPSDHAVVAGALITCVVLVRQALSTSRRGGQFVSTVTALSILSVVLGLFLCFARVYVGAHYPGDVIAGLLLGSIVVIVVSLARPIAYRIADAIAPTAMGILIRRAPAVHGPASQV